MIGHVEKEDIKILNHLHFIWFLSGYLFSYRKDTFFNVLNLRNKKEENQEKPG
jgi:hypothetical protein